jgi:hypothetical protein
VRRQLFAACVVALLGSCSIGAPPGFSEGDQWVIPLIGPVEDGLLLVPALVNDKGPFVFALDPDAHVSIIDEDVLAATGAHTGEGPRMLDENDTQQVRFYAEILSWQIGTLTVKGPKPAQIVGKGTFDADGRRIHGVLGRDIIADSLVLEFDRDTGVMTLMTQKAFKAPAGAATFTYSKLHNTIQNIETPPLPRRLVDATVGGVRYALHVDLGATTSQLRPRAWSRAKLVPSAVQIATVDEAGMLRSVKEKAIASSVTVGSITTKDVPFVPYGDKRWPDQDIEGSLGLGFFKPYVVTVNWDKDRFYLQPRKNTAAQIVARLGRWQSKTLTSCPNVGCIKASLIDPLADKPPDQMPAQHPGLVASFARDPSSLKLDLEVLVAVTPAAGKPALKWLVVNLPAGVDRAMTHVPADYIGATLTVLDASPFPRSCPAEGGCVDLVAAPTRIDPTATQVVPDLKRISGDDPMPSTEVGKIIGVSTKMTVTSTVKICVDGTGHVESIEIQKPSGLPAWDIDVATTAKRWLFEPYLVAGKPTKACVVKSYSATGMVLPPPSSMSTPGP